jgi:hypothetical protein
MVRILAVAVLGLLLSVSTPALGQDADPFMETPRLIDTCRKGFKAGDAAARTVCETYLMGIFDTALTIQLETRRAASDPTFTVLCNPTSRPSLEGVVENMLAQAENEPDSMEIGPAIYVIRTLNVPFSCK